MVNTKHHSRIFELLAQLNRAETIYFTYSYLTLFNHNFLSCSVGVAYDVEA